MSASLFRARNFAPGRDDFATVVQFLEDRMHASPPGSHDRAVALFEAIEWCVLNGQPVPPRIGMQLMIAYERFMGAGKDVPTLDAALGLKRPGKAERTAAARDYRNGGVSAALAIVRQVEKQSAQRQPIADDLFETVGKSLERPLSGPTVKRIYYEYRDDVSTLTERNALAWREATEAAVAAEGTEAAARLRDRLNSQK